jgi:hypothetical protein
MIILLWMGTIQGVQPTLEEQGYLLDKYGDSTGIYYTMLVVT